MQTSSRLTGNGRERERERERESEEAVRGITFCGRGKKLYLILFKVPSQCPLLLLVEVMLISGINFFKLC
jgi:hypothetical protein